MKISVLVSVYKTNPAFLREAIRSVLNQTFADFELILLDDCPSDPRESVVREFDDPRIHYEKNECNLGIAQSRNRLIDMAQGEYLAVFDHDDVCRSDRFEREVAWLDGHPECGVVSSWVRRIPVGKMSKWPADNLKLALMDGCVIAHTAAMIRKSVLIGNGIRYQEQFSPSEDWGLWIQLIPHTEFHVIQEPLVDYRWFAGNTSHRQSEQMKLGTARVRAWARQHLLDLYDEYRARADTVSYLSLFGVPLLKLVTRFGRTSGYLFYFCPILSIKAKTSLPDRMTAMHSTRADGGCHDAARRGDRVAVIMPIFNQQSWLLRCLMSLEAQTCRRFVVIAVDDGSTDGGLDILQKQQKLVSFDLRIVSKGNGGVSSARNSGLATALAIPDVDSIMFLDPDDRYLPTCIEKARAAHAAAPDAVVEWAFATQDRPMSSFSSADRLEPNIWCKLYPRNVIEDVRFCEATNIAEDLAFNLEVEHRHHPRLVRINEPLYFYEDNSASTMHRLLTARDFEQRSAVIQYIVSVFNDDPNAQDAVCRDEVPELLKQFWRDLRRVTPEESAGAHAKFTELIRHLKSRGLLHPKRGRMKDLKYYLRFKFGRF